jgi:hypothetical protein
MKKLSFLSIIFLLVVMQQVAGQASLWVTDPQNNWNWRKGQIEKATLSVKPAGTYFEMGLYLTFSSDGTGFTGDRQLEAFMYFSLPQGSIVLDSWLWVYEDIVQGKIIDKWTASNIYEGIVNRRRDPSILTKTGYDDYELRVYPMKPGEQRKVKITYLVPATWSNGKATIPMPCNILSASSNIPTLHTLVWLDEGWSNPDIPELEQDIFNPFQDYEFGQYYRYDIPNYEIQNGLSLAINAPLTNGMYLITDHTTSDEGVYQVAVDFKQFLDNNKASKVAILVDYEAANSNIPREQVFSVLEQNLLANYSESDSFNLFYSRYEIESFADEWLPVNEQNLHEAFQALKDGFMTLYSNLPGLLAKGNAFVRENNGGHIALYSNADNYGGHEKANALIKDIQNMNSAPIHIADFQNKNWSSWRIANRWYSGQEYLFINLSRITGGAYERLNSYVNLHSLCSQVFGSITGSISAFEFYSTTENGFCFGRYDRGDSDIIHLGDYYIQTGKYIGDGPFVLNFTGIYNDQPFSKTINVDTDLVVSGDSIITKAWFGQHIRELESLKEDNELVTRILAESIDERILSTYTAFLCLEPSDTVAACMSCGDESRLTGISNISFVDSSGIVLFPNPCIDFVTISFKPMENWNLSETKIEVFSILGELVYQDQPSLEPLKQVEINWDLSGNDGAKVADGLYIVKISNRNDSMTKRLIIK